MRFGLKAEPQVDWIKGEPPKKDNQVQTITGATISSQAVIRIINERIAEMGELLAAFEPAAASGTGAGTGESPATGSPGSSPGGEEDR